MCVCMYECIYVYVYELGQRLSIKGRKFVLILFHHAFISDRPFCLLKF